MGNTITISLMHCILYIRSERVDCSNITPYILGSETCVTRIFASDIDFS